MKFIQFAIFLDRLEAESSRITMTEILSELFEELSPQEVPLACYMMQGKLVPQYQSLEFNLSTKMLQKGIAQFLTYIGFEESDLQETDYNQGLFDNQQLDEQISLVKSKIVKKKFKQVGDIGLTIQSLEEEIGFEPEISDLSLIEVHQKLKEIAATSGEGSQDKKLNLLVELLSQLEPKSAKYICKIVIGKLRLGFSTKTMIDALSWHKYSDKSDSKKIEAIYQKKADIGQLAKIYLEHDIKYLSESFEVEIGVPVQMALCQRLDSYEDMIEKMDQVLAEPKYDGLRVQLHFDKKKKQVWAFSRSLEDITHMFPELDQALEEIKVDTCILDSEAIGYNPETGQFVEFQKTITRKRKYGVKEQADEVPIKFLIFDCLYYNGQSEVNQDLIARKKKVAQITQNVEVLEEVEYIKTNKAEDLRQYHKQKLDLGLEGAVVKKVNGKYRAGRKGWRWVKIKEVAGQRGKLNDTLDLIVMGYYTGKGKRTEFGIGAFLVGTYDSKKDQILSIAKIGTGLTDQQFKDMKALFDQHAVSDQPDQYQVEKELQPDQWVEPEIVVEIAADEITDSPLHTAGVALRFPRLVKTRDDKKWHQATTLAELSEISEKVE